MSAELHGTDRDPGYIRERAYDLYDMGIGVLTEEDARDLKIELDWEFGPAEVNIADGLELQFEDGCVSFDRAEKLDTAVGVFALKHWRTVDVRHTD